MPLRRRLRLRFVTLPGGFEDVALRQGLPDDDGRGDRGFPQR